MNSLSSLKTVLLDMDGVLWRGDEPVIEIQALFDKIDRLDLRAYCVTNNSTRSVDDYLEKLAAFNVSLERSRIITSAEGTAEYLIDRYPGGGSIYVIGEEGLLDALKEKGFVIIEGKTDSGVLAVVVGLDRKMAYQDLSLAVGYLQQGADFIGTNPDLTIPTPSGPAPGAGTLLKGVEVSSGRNPLIIGKPNSMLYELALMRAKSIPGETLMIGDRLETDILGAQQMGIHTALVLTGITDRERAMAWNPTPEIIAADALQVLDLIEDSHE
jgi:4-nitrophenyl phosphatase